MLGRLLAPLGAVATCLVACAASVPRELPASSPASDRAAAAPAPTLATALRSDPPLPGEPAGAWVGLEDAGATMPADMPGMDMGFHGHHAP